MERAQLSPTKAVKATVAPWSLLLRVNRKLRGANLKVRSARGDSRRQQLGRYFILDMNSNTIKQTRVDLESLARSLKCLPPWEGTTRSW